MNSTTKGIIAIIVVGGLVFATYKLTRKKSKRDMAQYINKKGYHSDIGALLSFGEDYIEAWYKAAKRDAKTFTLNGVSYKTNGGKLA